MEEKRYDPYTGEEIKEPVQEDMNQEEQEAVQTESAAEQTETKASPDTIVVGESGYYYQEERQTDYGYQQNQTGAQAYGAQEEPPKNSYATVSLVLGVLAIALACCCFPVAFILGIVAIVLFCISPKFMGKKDGKAVAGLICGICGIVLSLMITVFVVVNIANGDYESYINNYDTHDSNTDDDDFWDDTDDTNSNDVNTSDNWNEDI
ncbi:DUF4190 domain-containing protein [Anaerostipes sp.]|uniref:DUF4190 domain-containing protein n=1 Tax=Anaerostipes sp. TaxID=1872530 RepID=UPI0025B82578|nr:DUF4190 domain-containing protein [Anaerostipes sp.]MBS7006999.1 DUF4190 domain-containing protein [Anaerostipes sp.]